LDGRLVIPVIQELQRGFRIVLGIERDIESGLSHSQAKQFALAWAVFNQEGGGMRYYIADIAGNVPGKMMDSLMAKL
jgi:D-Tyr-tRNAtyr deacylase